MLNNNFFADIFILSAEKTVAKMVLAENNKLFLRKQAIIETVNDELKNIAQVEHSRHRSFDNFIVNLLCAIAAYCFFPKKPCTTPY